MYQDSRIVMGKGKDGFVSMLPQMGNRHGLIAGATGTGKTVTLKVMAESFSDMGVPVFLADIKGDLSGLCRPGVPNDKLNARLAEMGVENFPYHACPVRFWDIYGDDGVPVRATISDMGPTLLSRLLNLTNAQDGVLNIAFRYADDHFTDQKPLFLYDMKDLRAMLQFLGDNNKSLTTDYGNVTKQSVGAVLRALLSMGDMGGEKFFGEPMLDISDWIQTTAEGKGYINILHCVKVFQNPLLYSTFMLWMLSELFEHLPEVGDLDKPRMVFFFDEAHVLFDGAPKTMVDKVEQVVKLIRSKGVGIYFITQNPSDLPEGVLAQLGNRVQHALRAYTPSERKAVRAAAQSFRPNPEFSTEEAITQLSTGEALVSFLQEDGSPAVVERAKILPPVSFMGALADADRLQRVKADTLFAKYGKSVDPPSAYETLQEIQAEAAKQAEETAAAKAAAEQQSKEEKAAAAASRKPTLIGRLASSTFVTVGRELTRTLMRGVLGSRKRSSLSSKLETTLVNTVLQTAKKSIFK